MISKICRGRAFLIMLLVVAIGLANTAAYAADSEAVAIALEPQSLEQALEQFAAQTRRQVTVDPAAVRGLQSPRVVGTMTPEAALAALLAGTGLEVVQINGADFALRAGSGGRPGDGREEAVELEEVRVVGHYRDYDATRGDSFQLGLDLLRTPAAVSVISQDLLQDLQVNNVDEALRNVAGLTRFKTGNGGEERLTIRGFGASLFKDGMRSNNGTNQTNVPSTEPGNLERIEVLKGPSALLYGRGGPGGVVNYTTKRPEFERSSTLELLAGSYDFYKAEFDTTGAFSEGSPWAYRLVTIYENSESFRDEVSRERLLINPSISWTGDRGSLVAGVEYIDDDYTQDRGQVLDGDLFGGYFYSERQAIDQFYGIPGFNDQSVSEATRGYLMADWQFSDAWRIDATVARIENDKELFDTNAGIATPTFGFIGTETLGINNTALISANRTEATGETTQLSVRNFIDLEGPGGVEHRILASLTYEAYEQDGRGFGSTDTVFFNVVDRTYAVNNPFAPVDNPADLLTLVETGFGIASDFDELGINVLDYITLNDNWAILAGFRYSDFTDDLQNFEDDDLSFRGGVVYTFNDTLSTYLSYAEGYTSSGGRLDLNEEVIDPTTSTSWELGVKWQPYGDELLVTGTLFSVTEEGVAFLANPLAPPAQQRFGNIGEYETQGLELEVVGRINDRWRIQAGYAYLDNEIIDGGTTLVFGPLQFGFDPGNRFGGIAEHNVNFASFYEVPVAGGLLGFGGSAYYQDDVFISAENVGVYDSWVEVGLMSYFRKGQWKVQLNVNNVFDEEYNLTQAGATPDAFAAFRVGTSVPRTVIASVAYEF
ncbi:MAG: TonB-dependent receptor [Pseudomonadota bacterium]